MGHEIIKIGELEIYADEIAEITFNLYEDARIVRIKFFSGVFCDFETNEEEKRTLFDYSMQWGSIDDV